MNNHDDDDDDVQLDERVAETQGERLSDKLLLRAWDGYKVTCGASEVTKNLVGRNCSE